MPKEILNCFLFIYMFIHEYALDVEILPFVRILVLAFHGTLANSSPATQYNYYSVILDLLDGDFGDNV